GDGRPRLRCSKPRGPSRAKRFLRRWNCRTERRKAVAPCWLVIRPARAACTRPARGASFLLIVNVSMGRQFHGTVRHDAFIDHQHHDSMALTAIGGGATLTLLRAPARGGRPA